MLRTMTQWAGLMSILVQAAGIWNSALAAARSGPWQQYVSPEDAGWSAEKLEAIRLFADKSQSAAIMVVYRGHVLAAWGDVGRRFKTHSMRKSLLSALYGPHVESGRIDLKKTLAELGIDDEPPLTPTEKEARIEDILGARSGVYHPAAKEPTEMKRSRPQRGSHKPGEHFWYNNWDFNVAGVIFEKLVGKSIREEFRERIADPIGMEDFEPEDVTFDSEPCLSVHPAYSFRMSTRDVARFGQLFLDGGSWNGKAVVPAEWVEESTRLQSTGDIGYGYMWWVAPPGTPDNAPKTVKSLHKFMARGLGGQALFVLPEQELVFVHRGDTDSREEGSTAPAWEILERILHAQAVPPKENPKLTALTATPFRSALPKPRRRTPILLDSQAMATVVGEYAESEKFKISVHLHGNRLFLLHPFRGELELHAEAEDVYFADETELQVRFVRDDKGEVLGAEATYFGRLLPKAIRVKSPGKPE